MKFGLYLQNNLHQEWKFHYIDYEGLKEMINGRTVENGPNVFSEKDEAKFVEALEREVEKVNNQYGIILKNLRFLIFGM
jgi:SPX domain protein involved in polyphosphate accumulation